MHETYQTPDKHIIKKFLCCVFAYYIKSCNLTKYEHRKYLHMTAKSISSNNKMKKAEKQIFSSHPNPYFRIKIYKFRLRRSGGEKKIHEKSTQHLHFKEQSKPQKSSDSEITNTQLQWNSEIISLWISVLRFTNSYLELFNFHLC